MNSHEPTSSRKKALLADSVSVLNIRMSELVIFEVNDVRTEQSPVIESGTTRTLLSIKRSVTNSLDADSTVGIVQRL